MTEPTAKRKQPPTFRHLPLNRAKKLKQIWVENKKIKTKWKAQKRKEELSTVPTTRNSDEKAAESTSDSEQENPHSALEEQEQEVAERNEEPIRKRIQATVRHPSEQQMPRKRRKIDQQDKDEDADADTPGSSLRELTREAYSRSSLHTFKADAGRRTGIESRGRGGRGRGGRGGQWGETGRGQPNMKLRMSVMLEKIKQTIS